MKRFTLIDQSEVTLRDSGIYTMLGTSQTSSTWTLPSRYSTNSKKRDSMFLVSNVSTQCVITLNTRGGEQFRIKGITSNSITIRPQQECLIWTDGTYWIASFWKNEIEITSTFDPSNIANGVTISTNVTVTGAKLGDFVFVSFSNSLQGMILQGYVSAINTVTVAFTNLTGNSLDLASGTIKVRLVLS